MSARDNPVTWPRMSCAETVRAFRDSSYADPRSDRYAVVYKPLLNRAAIGLFLRSAFALEEITGNVPARERAARALGKAHPYYRAILDAALDRAAARPASKEGWRHFGYADIEAALRQTVLDASGQHDLTAEENADMLEGVATFIFLNAAAAVLGPQRVDMTYEELLWRIEAGS